MAELETPRTRLRPARGGDLDAIHAILSDRLATAYWSTPPHSGIEESRDWLAAMIAIPPGEGEDFVVEHDGRVIGKAGLYRFPEIGYIFHPDYWGRGLAREALAAILHRAFAVHRLDRVTADVDPRNLASLKLLAGLGFVETGRAARTWHVAGCWCDSIYLALEAPGA